jgi:hypothetical protein
MTFLLNHSISISFYRAVALPLTTAEGNQVRVAVNYSMNDESPIGAAT